MGIRFRILIVVSVTIFVSSAALITSAYINHKNAFLSGLDRTLISSVYAFLEIVPSDYHDRASAPESISEDEYGRYLKMLSAYANNINIIYIYSCVKKDEKFYFVTSNATPEEFNAGNATDFFDPYPHPPKAFIETWKSGRTTFSEYRGDWGVFRSVFMRFSTPKGEKFMVGADISMDFIRSSLTNIITFHVTVGILVFVFVLTGAYMLVNRILTPVKKLSSCTMALADNDFQLPGEVKHDIREMIDSKCTEVALFASAFENMSMRLEEYLEHIKSAAEERQRVKSELRIAHDIQMHFLPSCIPCEEINRIVDLRAGLWPAKAVGGDFYDYFLTNDKKLFIAIGDVSDKGVPAALFMAVIRAFLTALSDLHSDPAVLLSKINEKILSYNKSMMFATMFCALLDLDTGLLSFSSAGHNPPVIVKNEKEAFFLDVKKALPLGIFKNPDYLLQSLILEPGDGLLLYTDGITEARNAEGELLGEERLLSVVRECVFSYGAKGLLDSISESVASHSSGTVQNDDIALISVRYTG